MMFLDGDPITPILEGKVVGLMVVSVLLFIGSSIVQWAIKERMKNLAEDQKTSGEILAGINSKLGDMSTAIAALAREEHEQWGKISDAHRLLGENNLRLHDLDESLTQIASQQTQIATGMVNQSQNTQRVIEGLISALSDHARD